MWDLLTAWRMRRPGSRSRSIPRTAPFARRFVRQAEERTAARLRDFPQEANRRDHLADQRGLCACVAELLPQPRTAAANPMIAGLFAPWGLAAVSGASVTPSPAPSPDPLLQFQNGPVPSGTPLSQAIHDIAPPLDVFPYPPWMVATAIALAALLLGLIIWLLVRWIRRRPAPPPPSATDVALRELEKLRARADELAPYEFSVAVSDVLRTFIGNAKFRLPATRQDPLRSFWPRLRARRSSPRRIVRCLAIFWESAI